MSNPLAERLVVYCKEEKLNIANKRMLVAVSGGLDSMVLLHLLNSLGYKIGVAHCNFQLRGEESEQDHLFVQEQAKKLGVPFFSIHFDTKSEINKSKKGIQEVARQLRYDWFENIRSSEKFDWIAVAHHADDQVETILGNFIRGTGIKGLRGMMTFRDKIFRPLLFATRAEIKSYALENKIAYREDSSNAKNDYTRNKIRHDLIPLIESINPSFSKTIIAQTPLYKQLATTHHRFLENQFKLLFSKKENRTEISIALLQKTPHASLVLFDFLQHYGFTSPTCENIIQGLNSISGKLFFSATHRILKDRKVLILEEKIEENFTSFPISIIEDGTLKLGANTIQWMTVQKEEVQIQKDKNIAYIDKRFLDDTLVIRHWGKGDYFYPFGMKLKKKKVSKFFKDQKIAISDKEKIWILVSDQKIIWVVNHRTDERFKLTESTQEVVVFKWN